MCNARMHWAWTYSSILHSLELELIARTNVIWFVFRPLKVGAFISSWGHILPPPFLLRFNNITDSRNDQVLIDFILLSLLVNLYKQKNSSYHGLGIFFEIFEIFEFVFKNCFSFVCAWQDGRIKKKEKYSKLLFGLDIALKFLISYAPFLLKKKCLLDLEYFLWPVICMK